MSTSPERTCRTPLPGLVCRSSSCSPGWLRSSSASAGANATAALGNAVTSIRPSGPRPAADSSASAASTVARIRSAWSASRRPESVSLALRAVRSSSGVPTSRSSVASCWETADGV